MCACAWITQSESLSISLSLFLSLSLFHSLSIALSAAPFLLSNSINKYNIGYYHFVKAIWVHIPANLPDNMSVERWARWSDGRWASVGWSAPTVGRRIKMATADWPEPAGAASHWSEFDGSGGDWSAPPEHIQLTYTVLCVCVCVWKIIWNFHHQQYGSCRAIDEGWMDQCIYGIVHIHINVNVLERTYSPCYKIWGRFIVFILYKITVQITRRRIFRIRIN